MRCPALAVGRINDGPRKWIGSASLQALRFAFANFILVLLKHWIQRRCKDFPTVPGALQRWTPCFHLLDWTSERWNSHPKTHHCRCSTMTKQRWNPLRRGGSKKLQRISNFSMVFTYQTVTKLRSAAVARAAELTSQEMGHSWLVWVSMSCPSWIFAHDLTGSYTRPGALLHIHLFISRCAIGWNGIRWQEHFLGVCEVVHLPSGIGSLSELLVSKRPAEVAATKSWTLLRWKQLPYRESVSKSCVFFFLVKWNLSALRSNMNHLPFQDHWKFESSSESEFEMPAPSNRNIFFSRLTVLLVSTRSSRCDVLALRRCHV